MSNQKLTTAHRFTTKARYEPTNPRWCNAARVRYSRLRWSRRSAHQTQSSASPGLQGCALLRGYAERQAGEFAGFCNQKRRPVSAIFGVAKKPSSVTGLACLPCSRFRLPTPARRHPPNKNASVCAWRDRARGRRSIISKVVFFRSAPPHVSGHGTAP